MRDFRVVIRTPLIKAREATMDKQQRDKGDMPLQMGEVEGVW
jgi:hypothetical protein